MAAYGNDNVGDEDREKILLQSCRDGKRDVVNNLLSKSVRLDIRDTHGRTPLVLSSLFGHEDIVTLILDHSFDAMKRDGSMALVGAYKNRHWKIVKTLAERGADVNEMEHDEKSALILACIMGHDNVVKILIKYDIYYSVDDRDNEGKTPLMWACLEGHDKVVEILIKHDTFDLDVRDNKGTTALMWACRNGHDSVIRLLIGRVSVSDIHTKDCKGRTALMLACMEGHHKVVDILIKRDKLLSIIPTKDYTVVMAFIWACRNGCDNVVKSFLEHNIPDLNETGQGGKTALMWACQNGHANVVRLLVNHGSNLNINKGDRKGRTALMWACRNGRYKGPVSTLNNVKGACSTSGVFVTIIELLIKRGSDVNVGNYLNFTPLMEVCNTTNWCQEDCAKVIRLLVENGAKLDAQTYHDKQTAVMIAARANNATCLKALLPEEPDYWNVVDKKGRTAITYAMTRHQTDGLRVLLEDGKLLTAGRSKISPMPKNLTREDKLCIEPLYLTIEYGVFEWNWCPSGYVKHVTLAALNFGLSPGKIVSWSDKYNFSPLIFFLVTNDTQVIETLLERLYYYPEDYRTLCTDINIQIRIKNKDILDKIILQPKSLQTWCLLNVSKAISTSCFPFKRRERVDLLPIPDMVKRKLNFQ